MFTFARKVHFDVKPEIEACIALVFQQTWRSCIGCENAGGVVPVDNGFDDVPGQFSSCNP